MAKTSARSGGLSDLFRDAGTKAKKAAIEQQSLLIPNPADRPNDIRIFNVLDYIEQPWGLGTKIKLYPVQKFLVKLYYHLPLDDREKTITVMDMFRTKVLHTFTEKEYLKFLFNAGRCNIGEQDHERRELVLSIGRRSGKTTLAGIFASYELYRLLSLGNPHAYYGLPQGNRIQIISVATGKDQAGLLFNEVSGHLHHCEYFKPYVANNTQSLVNFRTPFDIERYGPTTRHENGKFVTFSGKSSLRVTFNSCVSKGLRGSGNIMIILDEVAHFQDTGSSSAKDIYDAVAPSALAFSRKDPETRLPIGPVESRIILISSPLGKSGKFYELYNLAMTAGAGSDNLLAIQAPTWEVNPTVETNWLQQKYHEDPSVFMVEFGAQFSDRVRGWIEREEDLTACIDQEHRPSNMGLPRTPHYMGIDVGLMNDGTSVFITHPEGDKVVTDYHEIWYAGVDWKASNPHLTEPLVPYANTLKSVERLDFEEIANWIAVLTKRFYIVAGLFDRWNGIPLEQNLRKRGLNQFTSEFFSRDQSSKIYQTVKLLMFDRRLKLYDWPLGRDGEGKGSHSPFIKELLNLQAEQVSKNLIIVAAAAIAGAHDDLSDSFVRSVWLAAEEIGNRKYVAGSQTRAPVVPRPISATTYQAMRARSHGVSERMAGRMGGRMSGLGLRRGR